MKQYRIPVIFITVTFAALLGLSGARAENVSKPASGTKVSEVDFPISCGAAAQKTVQSSRLDPAFVLV